jgi:hypothetical protein
MYPCLLKTPVVATNTTKRCMLFGNDNLLKIGCWKFHASGTVPVQHIDKSYMPKNDKKETFYLHVDLMI